MLEYANQFQNNLPSDPRAFRHSLVRHTTISHDQPDKHVIRSPLRYVLWPSLVICVPVTVLSTILLVIVFANRIVPGKNALDVDDHGHNYDSDVLVNFSASEPLSSRQSDITH